MMLKSGIVRGGTVALCLLILLGMFAPSVASVQEKQPDQAEEQETIKSRIADAKLQLLQQILSSASKSGLLWFRPADVAIVLTQSDGVSDVIRSITLRGTGPNEVFNKSYRYTSDEASALREGGAHKVFGIGNLDSDMNVTVNVSLGTRSKERAQHEVKFSLKRERLPVVVEIRIAPGEENNILKARIIARPGKSQIKKLLSRNVQYLIDTGSYLEAAVLIMAVLKDGSKEFGREGEWRLLLTEVYLNWGMDDEADQHLRKITKGAKSEAKAATAWFYLGKLRYRQGNYKEAVEAFEKAQPHLAPSLLPEALYLKGNSFLNQRSYLKAVVALDQVPKKSSMYPYAVYSQGLAHLNAEDISSAFKQFQKLISLNAKGDDVLDLLIDRAHITIGYYLVDEGRYEDAIEVLSEMSPASHYADQAQFGVAWVYFKKGEYGNALVVFEDLVSQWPDSLYSQEARLKIGRCYSFLKAYRKSVETYQEALRYYAEESDRLNSLQEDLRNTSLELWLATQRAKKVRVGRRSFFVRDLSTERSVLEAVLAYDGLQSLAAQMSRIEQGIDDPTVLDFPRRRLTQVSQEFETSVKQVISNRLVGLQKTIERRAIQADRGVLSNFNLVE